MQAKQSTRRGVVICGSYGMENAGDEAVLAAITAELRRTEREIPITVMTRRPVAAARQYGVKGVHPLRVLRWMWAMRRAKLFLSGGGTLLQDVTSRRSLSFYLLTIRLAKKLGCAVQLYGCGIAEKIRSLRMEKAKELLSMQKQLPLAEVAALCGYHDYNYFITVFSREVGCSPGEWRSNTLQHR